jgi:uncharacterized repeat protein (TIGR01451 family)
MLVRHRPPSHLLFICAVALLLGLAWQVSLPATALAQDEPVIQDFSWEIVNQPPATGNAALAGGQLDFTYSVCNPSTTAIATDVTVSNEVTPPTFDHTILADTYIIPTLYPLADTLAPGATNCTSDLAGAGVIDCNVGNLDPQACITFTMKSGIDPLFARNGPTALSNDVSATSVEHPNAAQELTMSTIVQDQADLQITKMVVPGANVSAGAYFTYTLFVDNKGPSAAHYVTVRDDILSNGDFNLVNVIMDPMRSSQVYSLTPTAVGGVSLEFILFEALEPNYVYELPGVSAAVDLGTLPPLGRWTVQLVLSANGAQTVQGCADVFTTDDLASNVVQTPDPNPSNNRSCSTLDVGATANLAVDTEAGALNPSGPQFYAGEAVVFTTTVLNIGPSIAPNVVVKDWLPEGLVPGTINASVVPLGVGISAAAVQCNIGIPGDRTAPLVCNLGGMNVNEQYQVVVSGLVDPGFLMKWPTLASVDLVNNVAVTSDAFDPNSSNNLAWSNLPVWESATLDTELEFLPTTGVAGEDILYTFHIFNAGPSAARNVIVGAGMNYPGKLVSFHVISGDVQCGPDADQNYMLECTTPAIAAGDVGTVEVGYTVRIDPGAVADTYNSWVDTFPYYGTNLPWSVPTPIATRAALAVTKTASNNLPLAGTQVTFDIAVSNNGPSTAYGVLVNETLPTGLTWVYDNRGCGPDFSTCTVGNLAPGQTEKLQVVALVEPDVACGTTLFNQVIASEPPTNTVAVELPVTVQCASDLRVLKFGKTDGSVAAGGVISYSMVVDNLGPSHAYSVTLDDLMAGTMAYTIQDIESNLPAACTPVTPYFVDNTDYQQAIRCTLVNPLDLFADPAAVDNRWIVTVYATAVDPGTITNVASVLSANPDPVPANNQASVTQDITANADLLITKNFVSTMTAAIAGQSATYQLSFENAGPSAAQNVVVVDTLPAALQVSQVTSSLPSTTCQVLPEGAGQKLVCTLGTLAAGADEVIDVVGTVSPDATNKLQLFNNVMVTSDTFDPSTANNYGAAVVPVATRADLKITQSARPASVAAGDIVEYYIDIENVGPSTAQLARMANLLPFLGAVNAYIVPTNNMTCVGNGVLKPGLNCIASKLAPGEKVQIIVQDQVSPLQAAKTVTNSVKVTTTTMDPYPDDNTAATPTTITGSADLDVTLEIVSSSGNPVSSYVANYGERVTYRVTVTNLGPSVSAQAIVSDVLPVGLTLVMNTLGCNSSLLSCNLGQVPSGESRTLDIVAAVDNQSRCGKNIVNVAQVAGELADPNLRNNTAKATVSMVCPAALMLNAQASAATATIGKPITFSFLMKNYGPSPSLDASTQIQLAGSSKLQLVSMVADGLSNRAGAHCELDATGTANMGGNGLAIICKANGLIEPLTTPQANAAYVGEGPDLATAAGRQFLPMVISDGWKQGAWLVQVTVVPTNAGEIAANGEAASGNPGSANEASSITVQVK